MDTQEDLTIAPGAADLTFGGLLCEMFRRQFVRVESLAPDRPHRFYTSCLHCEGSDNDRATGIRPSTELVKHAPDCLLSKHLPRLRAMMNKGAT